MVNLNLSLRRAILNDQGRIANLIYFESHVHRHLDWRSPLDWLGQPEYWVLEQGNTLTGVLACPADPPGVAWIRLFAYANNISGREAWQSLWQVARQAVVEEQSQIAAAITLQPWFGELLQESGFSEIHKIVILEHDLQNQLADKPQTRFPMRAMTEQDLPEVAALDAAAFQPIWRNTQSSLQMAFFQAGLATVMEDHGKIIGYQISTRSSFSIHLARLAIDPEYQGNGLAFALVHDLIEYARQKNTSRITVNTQEDNRSSLSLYKKLGFRLTGEQYPVYVFSRDEPSR
jgi:ribosomal protein S18 acetylase RimI-like enzyme